MDALVFGLNSNTIVIHIFVFCWIVSLRICSIVIFLYSPSFTLAPDLNIDTQCITQRFPFLGFVNCLNMSCSLWSCWKVPVCENNVLWGCNWYEQWHSLTRIQRTNWVENFQEKAFLVAKKCWRSRWEKNYVAMQLHGRSRQQRASGTAREVASWVWNSWGGVNIIATGDKT